MILDLKYYSNEIKKLIDVDEMISKKLSNEEFNEYVSMITDTILQYDTTLSKQNLKFIIVSLLRYMFLNSAKSVNRIWISNGNYNNSELGNHPQLISSAKYLMNHRHDFPEGKSLSDKKLYLDRLNQVNYIKKIPQFEQKSKEWLQQRAECLTATAVATALDEDPYKYPAELLLDKCGRGVPFVENENVHHGKKYEQIGTMFYAFRNNVQVAEYGLIQHDTQKFIGASPDGICESVTHCGKNETKLVGRLLEIKFPKTRKINNKGDLDGDICPHYYYLQVQTQLFVTKMDECDFLQCKIEEYASWEEYLEDSVDSLPGISKKSGLEKGCLIQLLPKEMLNGDEKMCLYNAMYLYPPRLHMSPEEINQWIADEIQNYPSNNFYKKYAIDKVIYWRLGYVSCSLILAETKEFKNRIPMLRQFWDYVLFCRKNPEILNSIEKYIKKNGNDKTDLIFQKVHQYYLEKNPDTTYQPLYQEKNKWRIKYDKKKAFFSKFNNKK